MKESLDKSLSKLHKTPTLVLVRRILKNYVAAHSKSVAVASFFMLLSAGLTAGFAAMIQPIIDDVLTLTPGGKFGSGFSPR